MLIRPLATLTILVAGTGSLAAADWSVQSAKGTALRLVGDQWEEVEIGEPVATGSIYRTLQSGRITFNSPHAIVSIAGGTAIEIDLSTTTAAITQYAGAVTAIVSEHGGGPVEITNPVLSASASGTTFTVFFDGEVSRVEVAAGEVLVSEISTGGALMVDAGDALLASAEDHPAVQGAQANAPGSPGGDGNAGGNASGDAPGNSGVDTGSGGDDAGAAAGGDDAGAGAGGDGNGNDPAGSPGGGPGNAPAGPGGGPGNGKGPPGGGPGGGSGGPGGGPGGPGGGPGGPGGGPGSPGGGPKGPGGGPGGPGGN